MAKAAMVAAWEGSSDWERAVAVLARAREISSV